MGTDAAPYQYPDPEGKWPESEARLEFVSQSQAYNQWIDVDVGIDRGTECISEVNGDIRIDPDFLDVDIECPATWLTIKVVGRNCRCHHHG